MIIVVCAMVLTRELLTHTMSDFEFMSVERSIDEARAAGIWVLYIFREDMNLLFVLSEF